MDVGSKIKKVRELKNFTQEHMAQRLNVSQSTYSRFEKKNDYDLTISQLHNIADEFGIKTEELLTFDEKIIFNNYGEIKDSHQFGGNKIENHFPEKLQQLYEDKIKLLEEKVAWLEKL
jgi:transcriptional regulator with XRE-family HTH domain